MPRDDALYVGHMLDTARKAIEKVERKSRTDFDADETLRLALAYLIQIVGEAASRVSPAFREVHAEVPWSEIIGMRHRHPLGGRHVRPPRVGQQVGADRIVAHLFLSRPCQAI